MAADTPSLNLGEQLLERFLTTGRTLDPLEAQTMAEQYSQALGLGHCTVYLVDIQQNQLVPVPPGAPCLPVEGSLAGWAFRTGSLRMAEDGDAGLVVWFPLVDGADRLGLLRLQAAAVDGDVVRRCRLLAALLTLVITAKRATSDSYARTARSDTMSLPAEILRAFLPPRTLCADQVISSAVLEPAYDLGGEAFEHTLTAGALHAAVLDAMGHDLASGLTAALALAACRNARRNGADLPGLVATIDDALARWFPDRFATGIFLRLDLATGLMRWSNCGHPAPLLIRDEVVVTDALVRDAEPPLGLLDVIPTERAVHSFQLLPGDRVLMYTDGVIEAKGGRPRVLRARPVRRLRHPRHGGGRACAGGAPSADPCPVG
ncbi:PP2C family protein-serine/threonine phosphatase [Streptomyces vietnamensis]|uniref:PP2C family protein-serine/threonine phosphatase n=1 Tax=Streptomyces vietnamensis TaxID=362257 RepID=UPI00343D3916